MSNVQSIHNKFSSFSISVTLYNVEIHYKFSSFSISVTVRFSSQDLPCLQLILDTHPYCPQDWLSQRMCVHPARE